jgi:hypothetical protein
MITANELRIGNLVKWEEYILPIKSIDYESVYVKLNEELRIIYKTKYLYLFINELEPVPLTEERLLKFGFEKDVTEYNICWFLNHVYIWFVDGEYINELDLPIKYVHQLQNLYFALKGEELTLKEDK